MTDEQLQKGKDLKDQITIIEKHVAKLESRNERIKVHPNDGNISISFFYGNPDHSRSNDTCILKLLPLSSNDIMMMYEAKTRHYLAGLKAQYEKI
jgi:hypothetical protein